MKPVLSLSKHPLPMEKRQQQNEETLIIIGCLGQSFWAHRLTVAANYSRRFIKYLIQSLNSPDSIQNKGRQYYEERLHNTSGHTVKVDVAPVLFWTPLTSIICIEILFRMLLLCFQNSFFIWSANPERARGGEQ